VDILSILLIAVGLAMDAFAVSISSGVIIKKSKLKSALTIALFFGLFQAIMPIIGWLAGFGLRDVIAGFDHWIAFGLLCIIGCKMIYESFSLEPAENKTDPLNIYVLFVLSIATSIDALAIGLSLSLLNVSIILPVVIIGIVTFSLSFFGVYIGNKFGHFFEKKIEIIGGLILIGIGIKILIEHL
jgi:putative Mn2+ efflux pump MntP